MELRSESMEYNNLVAFTQIVADVARRSNGFVFRRGSHGYHILFNESEMSQYFNLIRNDLANGQAGACLMNALSSGAICADSCNKKIWTVLMQSLTFSGLDFEHRYGILPCKGNKTDGSAGIWDFSFAECIVLGHTLLLVPVMQHYGPLVPNLDLSGPTKKFEEAQPLLVAGMVGDCVRGCFFDEIKLKAEEGDKVAQRQMDSLLNPERLQQKMRAMVYALLLACRESDMPGLLLDATLVGAGAFGGSTQVLAQPFADSMNGSDLPFDNSKDEVNLYMFPPPLPDELTLEHMKYRVSLNSEKGLCSAPEAADSRVRVVVAGFDPISLAPHGVLNRVFSAEGQICHSTDFLYRTTCMKGQFAHVRVPQGLAWESPAAYFAKPQVRNFKEAGAYQSVRFVPEVVLKVWGLHEGQLADAQLEATERLPPRVWNGDAFDGWSLSLAGVAGPTWQEVLSGVALPTLLGKQCRWKKGSQQNLPLVARTPTPMSNFTSSYFARQPHTNKVRLLEETHELNESGLNEVADAKVGKLSL